MKKYLKFFISVIIFAVVMILAINGYNNLKNKFLPEYSQKTNNKKDNLDLEGENNMKEITLTSENFEQELQNNSIILVDFWATWCSPCKMLSPVLSEIAEEYEDKIKIGKVNIDEETELATKYRITSIPTLILFKNGQVINTTVGLLPKTEIEEMINTAL